MVALVVDETEEVSRSPRASTDPDVSCQVWRVRTTAGQLSAENLPVAAQILPASHHILHSKYFWWSKMTKP